MRRDKLSTKKRIRRELASALGKITSTFDRAFWFNLLDHAAFYRCGLNRESPRLKCNISKPQLVVGISGANKVSRLASPIIATRLAEEMRGRSLQLFYQPCLPYQPTRQALTYHFPKSHQNRSRSHSAGNFLISRPAGMCVMSIQ